MSNRDTQMQVVESLPEVMLKGPAKQMTDVHPSVNV